MMSLTFHVNAAPKWVLLDQKMEEMEAAFPGSPRQKLELRYQFWLGLRAVFETQASPMVTVSRKAKQKHTLDFFMVVWFHRIKIVLYLTLITNNYNVIGHHLAQIVRCLLYYQLIKNLSSEHVFYLLLFALYYFFIMLKTYFSSESDVGIVRTHYFCMQYSIHQNFFFSLLPSV